MNKQVEELQKQKAELDAQIALLESQQHQARKARDFFIMLKRI